MSMKERALAARIVTAEKNDAILESQTRTLGKELKAFGRFVEAIIQKEKDRKVWCERQAELLQERSPQIKDAYNRLYNALVSSN